MKTCAQQKGLWGKINNSDSRFGPVFCLVHLNFPNFCDPSKIFICRRFIFARHRLHNVFLLFLVILHTYIYAIGYLPPYPSSGFSCWKYAKYTRLSPFSHSDVYLNIFQLLTPTINARGIIFLAMCSEIFEIVYNLYFKCKNTYF